MAMTRSLLQAIVLDVLLGIGCQGSAATRIQAIAAVGGIGDTRPCTSDPLAAPGVLGISLDGVPEVVFVVETSGGMLSPVRCAPGRPSACDVAKLGVRRAVEQLPEGTRVDIAVVHGSDDPWLWRKPRPLDTTSRAEAVQFVDAIRCENVAFMGHFTLVNVARESPRLIYLGAGHPDMGVGWHILLDYAKSWGEEGVRIDVIGLGTSADPAVLRELAARTGGDVAIW